MATCCKSPVSWFLVTLVAFGSSVRAAEPVGGWLGAKVLPKERCEISANGVVVNFRSLTFPLVVQKVSGPWLWVGDDRKGWVKRSQVVTLDEAPEYYTRLIDRNPRNGWAHGFRAVARLHSREFDLAIADYTEKLRWVPTAATYAARGMVWQAKHDYSRAIADYDESLRLNPNYEVAFARRGDAHRAAHDYARAVSDYSQAIRLNPNYSVPYDGLAWLRATCSDDSYRDGMEAIRLATRACELSSWTIPEKIGSLAAAYAEAGDFDKAVQYQQRVVDLGQRDAAAVQRAQQRLELFRNKKPYRDIGPRH